MGKDEVNPPVIVIDSFSKYDAPAAACIALRTAAQIKVDLRLFLESTHRAPKGFCQTENVVKFLEVEAERLFLIWSRETNIFAKAVFTPLKHKDPEEPLHTSTLKWIQRVVENMKPKIPKEIKLQFSVYEVWEKAKPIEYLLCVYCPS